MFRYLPYISGLIAFLLSVFTVFAEGTKEIMQYEQHNGRIVLDPIFGGFGMMGALPDDRLHIRILEPGEKIYYGLGQSITSYFAEQEVANDVFYRIVDPSGIVVVAAQLQPQSGTGFIKTYQEAVAGPKPYNPSGYDPLVITAFKTGDYYMDFYFPDADSGGRREFDYFDITVVSNANEPVPGRVWSKAWMFTVSEKGGDPWENPFYGKLFILSDDNIVTSVDFNGMQPFVFTLFANGTGVTNTGDPLLDRRSVPFKLTYPQYKVFLNNPDPYAFPSGAIGDFSAPTVIDGESPPYCIRVSTTKPGTVQVHIEINGIKGYQSGSTDLLIAKKVNSGENCIYWDGKDGQGKMVDACSGPVRFYVTYAGGLTHMPIYDVETNENGFIVELVRPVEHISHLALYWDDSNIPDHTVPPSEGCNGSLGCHKFGYFFGDSSTINTWWYAISDRVDSMVLFANGLVMEDAVISNQTCSNKKDGSIEIFGSGGEPPYQYALNDGPYRETPFFGGLEQGTYTVRITDANQCVRERSVNVGLNTTIVADFEFLEEEAYNRIMFDFTGTGAQSFLWDFGDGSTGTISSPLHQFNIDSTFYVTLIAESGPPDYCVDSVTKAIDIYPELQIYVPNAFSPNGDGLNEVFSIRGVAIRRFEIYIFSSNGTQLYYSSNLENSWDGTWNGRLLNMGVYAYLIRAYDKRGKLYEKKGTVTLVR